MKDTQDVHTSLAPSARDLSELLTACGQVANADAARRGIEFFFDFRGPSFSVPHVAGSVHRLATHLLSMALRPLTRGCVFFSVDVVPHLAHRATLCLQIAQTGEQASVPVVEALAAATSPAPLEPGDIVGAAEDLAGEEERAAAALCESLGGSLLVGRLPGEGQVLRAQLLLSYDQLNEDLTAAAEHGLEAWLVGEPPVLYGALMRRLERLGWRTRLLRGVEAALAHWERSSTADAGELPGLVFGATHYHVTEQAFMRLIGRLPPGTPAVLGRPRQFGGGMPPPANDDPPAYEDVPISPRRMHRITVRALAWAHRPLILTGRASLALAPRPKVLVAEDNLVNQIILREMIEVLGFEVEMANDGWHAVECCLNASPALVLMDVDMPVMSGIDATRRLRNLHQDGRLPRMPIVIASARHMPDDRKSASEAGADAYLEKPIDMGLLQRTIARMLAPRESEPVYHRSEGVPDE
ncbi:response regulator [Aquabacterium sp. A7-Y]|uniref:response regulator n=1 Tax=Aquabacterium sp. A7-Y TaxID=1349605 RepID=UPI00223D064D|nr:response regulator [Aquabacterium sp. A7-Y]MCW7541410.1 response regulator [Aquabacterium sp. A7-Y]